MFMKLLKITQYENKIFISYDIYDKKGVDIMNLLNILIRKNDSYKKKINSNNQLNIYFN
jgi:hypothetical protein